MPSYIKKSLSDWRATFLVWLPKQWGHVSWLQWLLSPISLLFYIVVQLRRQAYRAGLLSSVSLSVPVVVVGNITVGGAGKTPLTIALVKALQAQGMTPGIVSRGYGRQSREVAYVSADASVQAVGDEPLLLALNTQCPVYVGADRVAAGEALLQNFPDCDVIISDDGLQHYHLARQFEIAVVDGERGLGNRWMLPAGPLREPLNRLNVVNAIVLNGKFNTQHTLDRCFAAKVFAMQLAPREFYQLTDSKNNVSASFFNSKAVVAVAGIGHPERFFNLLTRLGVTFGQKAFPDHHQFNESDFAQLDADIILMTEKDAVKCRGVADARFWVLPVDASLDQALVDAIVLRCHKVKLKEVENG